MLYHLISLALFRLDAERTHELITGLLRAISGTLIVDILRAIYAYDDPILAIECAGMRFANPIGLAAGFDKRAELIAPMAALGFGHVEVGTATPRAQPGNDRPRLFRLPEDRALINRLGFNSPGMLSIARNLRNYRQNQESRTKNRLAIRGSRLTLRAPVVGSAVVGVNIGKNRATPLERAGEDYLAAFIALAPLADYVTINISSPNTPGLRRLHERAALEALLGELTALNRRLDTPRPLFLKISPDEPPDQIAEVVDAGDAAGITGFVVTNTTLSRDGLRGRNATEAGGMSGWPLAKQARRTIAHIHRLTGGRRPIIGVGGVASAADAYAHIRAGASLVQLYTGLVYEGPGLIARIKRDLAQLLRRDGISSLPSAIPALHE
jgi:dihydroorotate dehydrogenase